MADSNQSLEQLNLEIDRTLAEDRRLSQEREGIEAELVWRHQQDVRRSREEGWRTMHPSSFERQVAHLFRQSGYRARATGGVGDGGVDIVAWRENLNAVVQCKRLNGKVGPAVIRELVGAQRINGADCAILVTTGELTGAAIEVARKAKVVVIDVGALVGAQMDPSAFRPF